MAFFTQNNSIVRDTCSENYCAEEFDVMVRLNVINNIFSKYLRNRRTCQPKHSKTPTFFYIQFFYDTQPISITSCYLFMPLNFIPLEIVKD